jgi:hypothetical protein
MTSNFISEDDLDTFEGWLRYQAFDPTTATPEELAAFRQLFEEAQAKTAATPKLGLMKLNALKPGEYRYTVAVREGPDLLMTLLIRRDPKGDVYVMVPRGRGKWNPHASYHRDGTFHHKSHDHKMLADKRQALNAFRGCEHLGMFGGHGPKSVGAICDPNKFSGIVEVPDGILGPKHGFVAVDLVAPGSDPINLFNPVLFAEVFKEAEPWLVIRVGTHAPPPEAPLPAGDKNTP